MEGLNPGQSEQNVSFSFADKGPSVNAPSVAGNLGKSASSRLKEESKLALAKDSMRIMPRRQTKSQQSSKIAAGQQPSHLQHSINKLPSSKVMLCNRFLPAQFARPSHLKRTSNEESKVVLFLSTCQTRAALGPCSADVGEKRESARQIFKPVGDNGDHTPGNESRSRMFETKGSASPDNYSKATLEVGFSKMSSTVSPWVGGVSKKLSLLKRGSELSEDAEPVICNPVSKKSLFLPRYGQGHG